MPRKFIAVALYERTGNSPVKSVYSVFLWASASSAKKKTSHAALDSSGGHISSVGWSMSVGILCFLVDRRFLPVLRMCPLSVAVDWGKCL